MMMIMSERERREEEGGRERKQQKHKYARTKYLNNDFSAYFHPVMKKTREREREEEFSVAHSGGQATISTL